MSPLSHPSRTGLGRMALPERFVRASPLALARGSAGGPRALFQRFDLATRKLSTSIVPLVLERVPAHELGEAIRTALPAGDANAAPLFVYASVEALAGGGCEETPRLLVYRMVRHVEFDHHHNQAWLVGVDAAHRDEVLRQLEQRLARTPAAPGAAVAPPDWVQDASVADYAQRVGAIRAEVTAGKVHGAVLSMGLSRATRADPFDIYRECVAANPSPYGYVLQDGDFSLVGSSPLAFLQLKDGTVHLETDAGTRPVTGDAMRDDAAQAELVLNPKDAAEHQIVVDAETEALLPIAAHGEVRAVISKQVRRFSHVMHLYSAFEATLAPGLDVADAIQALAPAAAVSGFPKREALALGRALEQVERGPYGGVLGIVHSRTEADMAVVIRSLWITGGVARLRVGGKVVADSEPAMEYQEALSKSRFLVNAVARAESPAPR